MVESSSVTSDAVELNKEDESKTRSSTIGSKSNIADRCTGMDISGCCGWNCKKNADIIMF